MSQSQQETIVCASSRVFETFNTEEMNSCSKSFNTNAIQGCTLYATAHTANNGLSIVALLEDRRSWTTAVIPAPLEQNTLPTVKGTVWDLVSGITRALRSNYLFRWYGYFVLTPKGKQLEDSTLEYIGKHLGDTAFKSRDIYNVATGALINDPQASASSSADTTAKTPLPE